MIGVLELLAICILLVGIGMFTMDSKKSYVYRWLLLTISMAICVFCSILTSNVPGIVIGLVAFVLDFRLFKKSLREYNREKGKGEDDFFKELNRYCSKKYNEKKNGIREVWQ
jgi:MFS superfamily sulfate permease-like transporter